MYFYVDESGHTGNNLFDASQPSLYYGVLSSRYDINKIGEMYIPKLRKKLRVERLHAAELGNGGLASIARDLENIQSRLRLQFDFCSVAKLDHAAISFFDQVFDQGLNPAVPWTSYWTPLRYVLLIKLSALWDESLLKKAWGARIELNNTTAENDLVEICSELKRRVKTLPDARSIQVISESLDWVIKNPSKIGYNVNSKAELLSIAPNSVGFQMVLIGIAGRIIASKTQTPIITVDQQSQFNNSQKSLAEFYAFAKKSGQSFKAGPGLPTPDFEGMPTTPIIFKSGFDCIGLELVDVYLWIFKRLVEKKALATELHEIIYYMANNGRENEISIEAISNRWEEYFKNLPNPTPDQQKSAATLLAQQEKNRLESMNN